MDNASFASRKVLINVSYVESPELWILLHLLRKRSLEMYRMSSISRVESEANFSL